MAKGKTGLGKGLSALIRPPSQAERPAVPAVEASPRTKSDGEIAHIDVTRIRPNPFQPRADFNQASLDELKDSIKQKGIIQPVTVRRGKDGSFELISGERRMRAAAEIGLKAVPAYIIDVRNEEEMLELALVENLQREHLNPIEIAISYQRLMEEIGLTQEEVAEKVSKDRTTVTNFLRLLKLPGKIQEALRKGTLTTGHARALVGVPDELTQMRLFEKILRNDLNVRQVEKLVRTSGKKPEKKQKPLTKATTSAISTIEERLQRVLGTKVRIHAQDGGRGEILIEFYSSDDLGRLFDLIATIEG